MKPRILIIDDDKNLLVMFRQLFSRHGYDDVSISTDYQSMLADISADAFDLIFCDIVLGENSGIDFLKEMKNKGVETPMVLMTGLPDIETAISAVRLGAFDYIRKPVEIESMLQITRKAMEKRVEMEMKERVEAENKIRLDEDKIRLDHSIRTYQKHLQQMQEQIDSATDIYRDLVNLNKRRLSLDISWRNLPLAGLGGDFIDIRETDDIVDIIIADVAGHDIGSSYHTILLKAFFEENCHKGNDGGTLFRLLNRHLIELGGNERMITAVFLRIHLELMTLETVCAAQPWIVQLKKDSSQPVRLLETGGDVLGIHEDPEFAFNQFQLDPGDRLFAHTDGVAGVSRLDTESGLRKKLEDSEFDGFLLKNRNLPMEEMVSGVWRDILNYCENKPRDDMLFMGLEIPQPQINGVYHS